MSALVPAIILAVAAVFFVLYPVLSGKEASMERDEGELTEAQHRKNVALLALRDIEYDYHAGKLDDADYRALRQQVSAEALQALDEEQAERLGGGAGAATESGAPSSADRAKIEAEIAALRASIREGAVCTHCGHPNPRGSRFCGNCGAALPMAKVG